MYQLSYVCVSHIGRWRKMNQDNFFCAGMVKGQEPEKQMPICGSTEPGKKVLFGVFDGMGGGDCGEVASYLAAKRASKTKVQGKPEEVLEHFCIQANRDICDFARKNQLDTCGTTAALILASEHKIVTCNVGDSKIFCFEKGRLSQISEDHLGFAPFGQKPPLLQYLGIPPEEMHIVPSYTVLPYHVGNRYLICSDGLTDMLSNQSLTQCIAQTSLEKAALQMLSEALDAGGKDNITLLLLQVERSQSRVSQLWKYLFKEESK